MEIEVWMIKTQAELYAEVQAAMVRAKVAHDQGAGRTEQDILDLEADLASMYYRAKRRDIKLGQRCNEI